MHLRKMLYVTSRIQVGATGYRKESVICKPDAEEVGSVLQQLQLARPIK